MMMETTYLHQLQEVWRCLVSKEYMICAHTQCTHLCTHIHCGVYHHWGVPAQSQKISQALLRNHPVPLYWIAQIMNSMVLGHTNHPMSYEWHHIAQQLGPWGAQLLVYNYIDVYDSKLEEKLGYHLPLMCHSIRFDSELITMFKVQAWF